jgi:hypothetical protein
MAISPTVPRSGAHAWPMETIPDPEVPERPRRRRFPAAYKAAILDELDRASAPGAKAAILRREGLYSSHATGAPRRLNEWATFAFDTTERPMEASGRRSDIRLVLRAEPCYVQVDDGHARLNRPLSACQRPGTRSAQLCTATTR